MTGARSPWPLVGARYLTGLLAAAQLGKLSALAPLIAAELGLSLPTVALAVSLLQVGGATLGAAAGLLAQRLGLRRSLRWGLAALALSGLGGAGAQGAVGLGQRRPGGCGGCRPGLARGRWRWAVSWPRCCG